MNYPKLQNARHLIGLRYSEAINAFSNAILQTTEADVSYSPPSSLPSPTIVGSAALAEGIPLRAGRQGTLREHDFPPHSYHWG